MPQEVVVKQEDDPEEAHDDNGNPCMFFIAKGACQVRVKVRNILQVKSDGESDDSISNVRTLHEGDHFGEVSLVFGCKRTASVVSNNYCTLASLCKPQFTELNNQFENMTNAFKKHACLYDDDIKMFIEKEMDKVPYFRRLSVMTKNNLYFGFTRQTFEKGHFLCKRDAIAQNLILIAEGVVEASCAFDRRVKQQFIIERLGRGAIINSQTFMLNDDEDTDFVCTTTVSAYMLTTAAFEQVVSKRSDLKEAQQEVQQYVFRLNPPQIALDYIIHNKHENPTEYNEKVRTNHLKVQLKNAIMQTWSEVKKQYKVPSINETVNELLKNKRDGSKSVDQAQVMREKQKAEKKMARAEADKEQKEQEAKDSYLKVEQYDYINEKMLMIKRRLKAQQSQIDTMERKMLATIKRRMEKEAAGV